MFEVKPLAELQFLAPFPHRPHVALLSDLYVRLAALGTL